ncbi:MAG: short-subunit dehydrogenase [Hyphomicrobiaceae bacterium]|jgi:short-subunit dehydrogenase
MSKKLALITGASSGIGAELAREHAAAGGDLILVARSREPMEKLAEELSQEHGTASTIIVKDLACCGAGEELYADVKSKGFEIDYLINNAGFGGHGFFKDRTLEEDSGMIHLNIVTLMELTKMFLPDMLARDSGRILNVGSVAGFMPGPLQAVYYATKAFVNSFTEALANELEGTNVTATVLCPGLTDSGFMARGGLEGVAALKMPLATSEDVAKYGYKALVDGDRVAVHGMSNKVLVNFGLPLFPRNLVLKISRAMMEK